MQHQLSSPPKPFLLYFEDPSTVSAVQLPIKARKNDSVLFHEVRGDKVRATPIQHSLPTGDERRLFVLIAQFLIEGRLCSLCKSSARLLFAFHPMCSSIDKRIRRWCCLSSPSTPSDAVPRDDQHIGMCVVFMCYFILRLYPYKISPR